MNASQNLPWPGWEIVRRLGGGSYGKVYEIHREQYHIVERAALKVISFPSDPEEVEERCRSGCEVETLAASYRRQMERVLEEYSLMMQLKRNPNVVLCDTYETVPHADGIGWDIYIRMELLTPLKKYLGRVITPEQTIRLGEELCNALIACREKDIIHRDIKPDNILMTETGAAKLGDFGIAKIAEKTMAGTRTGTPGFIAPEVFHNEPYGKSVDIYSLGMVLYWMLNRRTLPFLPLPPEVYTPEDEQRALQRRMQGEALPRPADGSRTLQDVVLRACAYDPADRYATPEEFCRALEAVRAADTSTVDNIPDAQPVAPAAEPSFPDADATMGNNWETIGGRDDSDYTETFNTDPTMETMGTEGGASASSEARRQDAGTRGKDVYTLVRITPQEAAAGCKVETKDAAGRTVRVAIPQGVKNGAIIRVNGHGAAGIDGGAPGDLMVRVLIESAPAQDQPQSGGADEERSDERARGQDVYTLVHITPQEAAAGCKVETKDTAGRTVCVAIPQGVENGAVVRVNGHGAAGIDGGAPGDLQVRVYVQSAPAQKSAPAPKVQTTGTAARKRKRRNIWIIAAAAALLVACIVYIYGFAASDVEFDSGCVTMSGHITAITVGRAERLLSEHDCTELVVDYDLVLGTPSTVSAFAMRRLGTLTNLTSLCLCDRDNISDLSPLSNLTNLTSLYLFDCDNISDLSPLSNLTNLTSLDLGGCDNISNLSPLSNLTNLTSLDLHDCKKVSDLSPLSSLEQLKCLGISGTDVKSLHGLENARKLLALYAEGCNLTDTSALEISGCMSALRTN